MKSDDEETVASRPQFCEQSQLGRADGSSSYAQGDTVVMAAVYGPTKVSAQNEIGDEAYVEIIFKPKSGLAGCAEKLTEHLIKGAVSSALQLSLYPRTSITIIIQELHNAGSLLACCINAACLALMDSGISIKYLVAAASCSIGLDAKLILDPTLRQEKDSVAKVTMALDNTNQDVVCTHMEGVFSSQDFVQCFAACQGACQRTFQFYRHAVEKKMSKVS